MRVIIADDHPLTREGVKYMLTADERIEVVGEASNGAEVLPLIARTQPDVVLLDIRMPVMDGLTCLDLIRRRYPEVRVVIFSQLNEPDVIESALKGGATGFIVKTIDAEGLSAALRQAYEGTVFHPVGATEFDAEAKARALGLTKREIMILKAVASGMANRDIAKELWVTEQTIKFHLTNAYRKIKVRNRLEAARCAYQLGLVESPALSVTRAFEDSVA